MHPDRGASSALNRDIERIPVSNRIQNQAEPYDVVRIGEGVSV